MLVGDTDNMKGEVKNEDILISCYYAKKSRVIVRYQDKESKKEIAKEDIINGYVGKEYDTERINIQNYIYKDSSKNTKGTMTNKEIIVYYYYEEKLQESQKYIDDTVAPGIIPQTGQMNLIRNIVIIGIASIILSTTAEILIRKYNNKGNKEK